MKQCKLCKIEKILSEFYKDKNNKKDGFQNWCINCHKIYHNNSSLYLGMVKERDKNKKKHRKYSLEWYQKNKIKYNERNKKIFAEKRFQSLSFYSNNDIKCNCCNEKEYKFLCIDHINGGGNEHRRQLKASNIYTWLVKNNFPEGYQVLCHNCNMAKSLYKICPHKIG